MYIYAYIQNTWYQGRLTRSKQSRTEPMHNQAKPMQSRARLTCSKSSQTEPIQNWLSAKIYTYTSAAPQVTQARNSAAKNFQNSTHVNGSVKNPTLTTKSQQTMWHNSVMETCQTKQNRVDYYLITPLTQLGNTLYERRFWPCKNVNSNCNGLDFSANRLKTSPLSRWCGVDESIPSKTLESNVTRPKPR